MQIAEFKTKMEEEFFPNSLKELRGCSSCEEICNWRLNFSYQLTTFTVENDEVSPSKEGKDSS